MKRIIIGIILIMLPYLCFANWFVAASGGITMPNIKAQDNIRQDVGFTLQTGRFILNKKAFITLSWDYLATEYYSIINFKGEKSEVYTDAYFSNFALSFNYFIIEGAYANIGIGTSNLKYKPKSGKVGEISYLMDAPSTDDFVCIIGVGYLQPVYNILSLKIDIFQNTDFNKWSYRNNFNLRAGLLIHLF
jgi:hypothetical protein